ncbi:uncharacterized protein LOC106152507 [Lingula anatina]|uniref:Uncharacterized protein LOC106152507 n=1 Tax=Lingula anatina TaxID=7574 RepID=A0A1S3H6G4_LINAN|nr:uncharacterized protein LOC106152507 [Lingula anatina]|eukprot:XP_013381572.2 uncharacterized protein LOC106152507 [Lingula anatina]
MLACIRRSSNNNMRVTPSVFALLLVFAVLGSVLGKAKNTDLAENTLVQRALTDEELKDPNKRVAVGAVVAGVTAVLPLLEKVASYVHTARSCVIAIANQGNKALVNPTWYTDNGVISGHPPYTILPNTTGLLEFDQGKLPAGTEGVVAYEVAGTNWRVAVMWSVPYIYGIWSNHFHVKVYNNMDASKEMFKQMYHLADPRNAENGGYINAVEHGIVMRSTMTDSSVARLAVWVDPSNPEGDIWWKNLHSGCSYNALWFSSYCWRECPNATGWCWQDIKCSNDNACSTTMAQKCHSGC